MLAACYLCSLWLLASGLLGLSKSTEVTKKTITLNLKNGEKNAYLDEGFASFVLVKNDSLLTNPDVLVFPQYGFESDANSLIAETELLQTEISAFFPMFDQGRALLIQMYPGSQFTDTPPAFNCISFTLDSGSYSGTKLLPMKFDINITNENFSNNPTFFKPLTASQLKNVFPTIASESHVSNSSSSFSFFTFKPQENELLQFLCEIEVVAANTSVGTAEQVMCSKVYSKMVNPQGSYSYLQFTDMQVVDYSHDSVAVILYSPMIAVVEFARNSLVASLKFLETESSYNFIRWFAGGWYGITKQGGVDNLVKLKLTSGQVSWAGEKGNSVLKNEIFIPNEKRVTFNKLWVTNSVMVLQYMNPASAGEFGVAMVYFSEPSLIPGTKYVGDPNSDYIDILDQSGRVLKQLMYPVEKGEFIQQCMEWNGTVVLFGRRMLSILPVPLTLNIPKDRKILYQMNGNMNSTYSISGSNIFNVLPTPSNKRSRSMTILKDSLLLMDPRQSARRRVKMQIQEVSVTHPVVQLDTFDESKLLEEGPLEFDVCYTYNITMCNMVQYKINYIDSGKRLDYRIIGALVGIGLLLLIAIVMFIVKTRKAIRGKKKLTSTLQKHQTLLAEEDDDSRQEALNFSGYNQKKAQPGY